MLEIKKKSINLKQEILIIIFVCVAGLIIRFYFFPNDIPIRADAIDYFSYTIALARGDIFPDGYLINKFGWPIFLSPFFAIFNNLDIIQLMNIQRIISISISVLTIIPLYYLIRKFFRKEVAIVAASLFIFSPKVIENSLLGITDPLFIFFITLSIMFVFIKNSKYYFVSFIIAGFAFIVRQEGILILIPLILSLVVVKKFKIKRILKFILGLSLFCGIAFSADYVLASDMNMSIFDTVVYASQISEQEMVVDRENNPGLVVNVEENIEDFIKNGIFGFSKYIVWILLPNLICFTLFSIVAFKKKISLNKFILFMFFIILSLTGFFAYGKGVQETRYLLTLIPIVALFSGYGINWIYSKIGKNVLLIIIPIVISSGLFLIITENDRNELEYFEDARNIIKFANGINNYEGSTFLKVAEMEERWPDLVPYGENRKILLDIKKFSSAEHENVEDFIIKNYEKGLTHLVIYQKNNSGYLDQIFANEEKFSYLEKVFESKTRLETNSMKIFYINYAMFDKIINDKE